jgi:ribonuclease HI
LAFLRRVHGETKGFGEPQRDTPVSPPSEPPEEVVVWTDGGARGNPGPAGYGAVVTTPSGQVLDEVSEGIGWATNNVAEYRGVIAGLRRAKELGARRVRVRADSLLVVNQQKGLWKVKNAAMRPLAEETARLAHGFERVVWEHVPRERNGRADALANRAMDDQGRVEGPVQGTSTRAAPPDLVS